MTGKSSTEKGGWLSSELCGFPSPDGGSCLTERMMTTTQKWMSDFNSWKRSPSFLTQMPQFLSHRGGPAISILNGCLTLHKTPAESISIRISSGFVLVQYSLSNGNLAILLTAKCGACAAPAIWGKDKPALASVT
jgi:hypothetical protein